MYAFTVDKKIYTVSRLNQEVQQLLESGFGTLWLQGELSNFSRPASGHFYFSLKDSQAQIRCAMFKGRNRTIDFRPENGDAVVVRGKLGLYAARGDFQLIVEHMEPAGAGKLQAAFEAIKRELDARGWFAQAGKQPIPVLPRSIGVVTSPTGAALRDVLHVLQRRYRQADIIIYPTQTQGAAAAPAIVRALQTANRRAEVDVLLLVRGGGSLEDLWAFNEVAVAEAVHASTIPVVAGIGHEVDVTICDLVADLRAPTPSAAAELATPDTSTLQHRLDSATRNLTRLTLARFAEHRQGLAQRIARLQLRHPQHRLFERAQRTDELQLRLNRAWSAQTQRRMVRLQNLARRLDASSPSIRLGRQLASLQALRTRLQVAMTHRQQRLRARFELQARMLDGVSPLAVLDRGYALIEKEGKLVSQADSLAVGDDISARLAHGEISAVVSDIRGSEL
ncbi:MAG: exodeoxyribonuclease VII large subunit [Granulosicoccus sp.]|nr:exodeoxyribonuclease VII large subunit [Granulosicoccus sp.]